MNNYLTYKLNEEYLNHSVLFHVQKHLINQVDLITILQVFIAVNDRKRNCFAKKYVL